MRPHPNISEAECNEEILRQLASAKRNGHSLRIEPDYGTGIWNWWEVANATIVGAACDRWLRARYERTRDRMIMPVEYHKAVMARDCNLITEKKRLAALAGSEPINLNA